MMLVMAVKLYGEDDMQVYLRGEKQNFEINGM